MHKHVVKSENLQRAFILILLLSALTLAACRDNEQKSDAGVQPAPATPDVFHADNDIAMTVRSLADALKVGEPLDSAEYDYEGILTDGQGTPLYTDIQGAPGVWVVDVLDPRNVMIRNLYLGDLLPDDLQSYLLQSLNTTGEARLDFTAHEAVDDDETDIAVYDCGGVFLRFEVRAGIAPNGIEGPQLSIIMTSETPTGVEIQTAV